MLRNTETHRDTGIQTEKEKSVDSSSQTTSLRRHSAGVQTLSPCVCHTGTQTMEYEQLPILMSQSSTPSFVRSRVTDEGSSISNPTTGTMQSFGFGTLKESNAKAHFYTGLPTYEVFVYVLSYIKPHIARLRSNQTCLKPEDEFLLVLMKLRLNLLMEDLAYRFGISKSTATIFHEWISVMFVRLKFLIHWPSKDVAKANMPQVFYDLYPNARCIIDCSEIFLERPLLYQARAQTYSNYKKHNTVKILIAITPNGALSFLSKCWGGRVSDKTITQESGFLQLLDPGDVVLADRGFTIADDVGLFGAKLEIPAFTRGKKQLTQWEVEYSARLAKVRIHIERVIGHLKNKYTILKGTLPISIVKHEDDNEFAFIDKIVTVCAALTNLSKSVVPC